MSSEIRVNKINNRAGLGTVEYTPTGIIVSGIVTAYEFDGNFDTTPGIVVTGIATAAAIDLNGDLDVDGHTNLDNVSIAGVTTMSGVVNMSSNVNMGGGNLTFSDSGGDSDDKLVFGQGADFKIFHNGSNNYIDVAGDGHLYIRPKANFYIQDYTNGEVWIDGVLNGGVQLYNNGIKRFETDGNGITVQGNINMATDSTLYLGAGNDFRLFHNGTTNYIRSTNGNIQIDNSSGVPCAQFVPGQGTKLYYGSAVKFTTETSGVNITGVCTATSFVGDGSNLTGLSGVSVLNQADNRLITATGTTDELNAEANLTWSGAQLYINCGNYDYPIVINSVQSSVRAVIRQTNDANANSGLAIQKKHSSLHPANHWYGDISFEGWDGSGYHKAGLIECVAVGTPANDNMPGELRFSTNAGAAGVTKILTITKGGSLYHTGGGNDRRYSFASDGTAHYLSFDNTLNGIKLNGYGGIAFETNGTNERARIDGSGNFIIGSTSAEAKLDVTGGVSISSNGVTVSPSGYDLKIRSNTGKLGVHIDNSSGTPTLEFGTGNATTGGAITTNNYGIFLKPGNVDKLKVEPDGVRSFATFVDTSYHANPDPLGDGSGIAYYRLNYNFQDSGRFGNHGQGIQGGDPTFALVNSSGEPCWQNPTDGAINLPNLKNSYPFSMAAWINLAQWSTTSNNDLIMNLSIGGQRVSLSMCTWGTAVSDGMDFYIMYGGTGHHYFRPSSKPTNTWIHVVYSVVSSNNTAHRVYQNGADLTTRGNRGGSHGGSAGWAMGGNAANSERFGIGRIGSIRFFNKALSSSEASALYTNDTFYT